MWRGFVVFIEIVLLVLFLRTAYVQYFLKDIQAEVSEWIAYLNDIPKNNMLDDLREQAAPWLDTLGETQATYVNSQVLTSAASINRFYDHYCVKDDINPFLDAYQRRQFCHYLEDSPLLQAHQ